MALVEVYAVDEEIKPLLIAPFDFLPRIGETLSMEAGGYFEYYKVVEVWHRQNGVGGIFQTCLRVELDD